MIHSLLRLRVPPVQTLHRAVETVVQSVNASVTRVGEGLRQYGPDRVKSQKENETRMVREIYS